MLEKCIDAYFYSIEQILCFKMGNPYLEERPVKIIVLPLQLALQFVIFLALGKEPTPKVCVNSDPRF